ncbi:hypothetical protein V6N13_028503 [Hibiscus sabdariffa]|uniref:Uncharacterized protein n=2 Tax=Hibiscus sabdariffa TaxID=183260 RepID=A0ABR1ZM01_9ROSI
MIPLFPCLPATLSPTLISRFCEIYTRIVSGKEKGTFGKVGPIGCLHSSDDTEEERNEVRGRGAGKRVGSTRLDDREKQNEIRIWPKKKQRYGYHDRSPSIKKNLSKSLRVSEAFKHPKYARVVNDIAFLIENDDSFIGPDKPQFIASSPPITPIPSTRSKKIGFRVISF